MKIKWNVVWVGFVRALAFIAILGVLAVGLTVNPILLLVVTILLGASFIGWLTAAVDL